MKKCMIHRTLCLETPISVVSLSVPTVLSPFTCCLGCMSIELDKYEVWFVLSFFFHFFHLFFICFFIFFSFSFHFFFHFMKWDKTDSKLESVKFYINIFWFYLQDGVPKFSQWFKWKEERGTSDGRTTREPSLIGQLSSTRGSSHSIFDNLLKHVPTCLKRLLLSKRLTPYVNIVLKDGLRFELINVRYTKESKSKCKLISVFIKCAAHLGAIVTKMKF